MLANKADYDLITVSPGVLPLSVRDETGQPRAPDCNI